MSEQRDKDDGRLVNVMALKDARIAELESERAAMQAEIERLKAENFRLSCELVKTYGRFNLPRHAPTPEHPEGKRWDGKSMPWLLKFTGHGRKKEPKQALWLDFYSNSWLCLLGVAGEGGTPFECSYPTRADAERAAKEPTHET